MSRRVKSLDRKVGTRKPKRTFYLICEGSRTEPDYFRALKRTIKDSLVEIEIAGGVGVPMTIAKAACELAKRKGLKGSRRNLSSFESKDEVWAVFDRDSFEDFNQAIGHCRDGNVFVARSIPCFEVWLILHFKDYDRDEHHHDTQRAFEQLCSDYDRKSRKTTDCDALISRVSEAEDRAERQLGRRRLEGDDTNSPSTTVFQLTRRIRMAAQPTQ